MTAPRKTTVRATRSRAPERRKNAGPLVPRDRHEDGTFSFDPTSAVAHLRSSDPDLARLIDAVGPFAMELKATHSVFVALAEAIVYQQLHGKAAATIFGRICALFPGRHAELTPENLRAVSDEALRSAGLSGSKLASLRDLSGKALDGTLPSLAELHAMDDEEVIDRLTVVRGIGRWTAEMFLVFRLGRPDVLPLDDFGVRQGFTFTFRPRGKTVKSDLERRGDRWTPYRSVASWYLWRAVELHAKTKAHSKPKAKAKPAKAKPAKAKPAKATKRSVTKRTRRAPSTP